MTKRLVDPIIREYANIAFSDMTDFFTPGTNQICPDLTALPEEKRRCIKKFSSRTTRRKKKEGEEHTTVEVWLELHPKIEALKSLGTYCGLFGDFNNAIAILANKYGIEIWLDEKGEPQARRRDVFTDTSTDEAEQD